MDRQTAKESASLITFIIGEIIEDHVDSALAVAFRNRAIGR